MRDPSPRQQARKHGVFSLPFREYRMDDGSVTSGTLNKFDSVSPLHARSHRARSTDKVNPAMLMAAARLDLPTICIPGGACAWNIRFCTGGEDSINTKDYESLEMKIQTATPATCGACEIMGTANTGQILMEALGMALPRTSAIPAFHEEVLRKAREAGKRIVQMIREGLTDVPRGKS